MKYSIIIPIYKNLHFTKKCLESIFKNTKGDFEVIAIDDNSQDGTAEFLTSQKNITAIINKKNQGFAKNCNLGAKKAKGDILIFLNYDTEVHKGWLEAIDKVVKSNENLGAVGVKLLFPDGTIQHAGVVISPDKVPRHIYYQQRADLPEANVEREFQVVTAACIVIPKNLFEKVNGFDEEYKNGLEDVDLCLKIGKLGKKIIYTPKSVITHFESVAPGRFAHNKHNADLYMSRWKDAKSDEHDLYKHDGKNSLWILSQDLRSMSYGPDEYGTRPGYISILRLFYIPLQKVATITKLISKGDLRGLVKKVKGKIGPKFVARNGNRGNNES